ncbi:MAG: hypothetical protein KGL35_07695 [Bradyrhizobium sp.]|nr:hypothetical protein [Bradyrhizobium sp.]
MMPLRDRAGRFLPRHKHDPLHPYVVLQEDGLPGYLTASYKDAAGHARAAGARLVLTREGGAPLCLLKAAKPLRAVL